MPCKLILYVPDGKLLALLSVTIVLPLGVTGLLLNVTLLPAGTPEITERVIGFAKPFIAFVLKVTDMVAGAMHVAVAAVVLLKVKPPAFKVGTNTVLPVDKVLALSSYKTVVGVNDKSYDNKFPLMGAPSPLPA